MYYAQKRLHKLDRSEFAIRDSEVLTMKTFKLFFSSGYSGVDPLSWQAQEHHCIDYYKAKGFQYSEHPQYLYFISIIDDDFEACKVLRSGSFLDSLPLNEEEVIMLEKAFSFVIEHCGWNKSFEERYAHIKATRINKKDIEAFVAALAPFNMLCAQTAQKANLASIAAEILECAQQPVTFFKTHESYLVEELYIDEPIPQLYRHVLMGKLMQLDAVYDIDWKDGLEEIQPAILALSGSDPFIDLPDAENCDAEKLLSYAGDTLAAQGLCLVNFNNGSDTDQISITKSTFEDFYSLCKKLKIKVQRF